MTSRLTNPQELAKEMLFDYRHTVVRATLRYESKEFGSYVSKVLLHLLFDRWVTSIDDKGIDQLYKIWREDND